MPLWGIAVYFVYAMRRVDRATCGMVMEKVPWANGKKLRADGLQVVLPR